MKGFIFSTDMWEEPLWPLTAAWQLPSSLTLTQSLLLLLHTHCPVCWFPLPTLHTYFLCFTLTLSVAVSFSPSVAPVPFPPSCPAFYSAAPLTSAGIIPIMQSLCPDGQRDEFGFLQYKNSTWVGNMFTASRALTRSVLLIMMVQVQRSLTPPSPSQPLQLKRLESNAHFCDQCC